MSKDQVSGAAMALAFVPSASRSSASSRTKDGVDLVRTDPVFQISRSNVRGADRSSCFRLNTMRRSQWTLPQCKWPFIYYGYVLD